MVVAALTKIKIWSGDREELIDIIKKLMKRARFPGHVESVYYLADKNQREFYEISFWQQISQVSAVEDAWKSGFFHTVAPKLERLEQENFDLIWEFRRLPLTPVASNIRLLTLPKDIPETWLDEKVINIPRRYRKEIPGLIGCWIGRSRDNPGRVLQRVDWSNLPSQQDFFNSKPVQEALAQGKGLGVRFEYASYELQSILHAAC